MRTVKLRHWGRIALFAAAAAAVYCCQLAIDQRRRSAGGEGELMYFPSARFTQAAALGYDNLLGDWVWLDIIQYYGRHKLSDLQFTHLRHMLDVLTTLMPRFSAGYKFGALLLITDAGDPDGAFALLDQGLRNNPDDWTIAFNRGFLHYALQHDYREGGRWFTIASHLPGATEAAARFAAFARQRGNDLPTARALWQRIVDTSRNRTERMMAEHYVRKIDRELLIGQLGARARQYRKRTGRVPVSLYDLVREGLLPSVPSDPMGGRFVIDRTGSVVAVGGERL